MKCILILTALLAIGCGQVDDKDSGGSNSNSEFTQKFFTTTEPSLTLESVEDFQMQQMDWASDCTQLPPNSKFDPSSVRLDVILQVGKKLWEILDENQPVINTSTTSASALPQGIRCWNQLSHWSPTRVETYRLLYKNLYGVEVVDIEFSVLYNYGGRMGEKGRYLTNSTIKFNTVDVVWGFEVNANVEIPQVVNVGTMENPVGAMQMTLNYSIDTKPINLRKIRQAHTFEVFGDGRPTRLLK